MSLANDDARLRDFVRAAGTAVVYLKRVSHYAEKHNICSLEDLAMAEEMITALKDVAALQRWDLTIQPGAESSVRNIVERFLKTKTDD